MKIRNSSEKAPASPAAPAKKKRPHNTPKHSERARETAPKKLAVGAIARTAGGKFAKGASPNPGGRPAIDRELREAAGAHTLEALQVCVEIMRDKKRDPSVRLVAAKSVIDRAVGKPAQPIAGAGLNGSLVTVNVGSNASVSSADAAAVYHALCGDPSLDVSAYLAAAPAAARDVARPPVTLDADPLAPVPSSIIKTMEKCAK